MKNLAAAGHITSWCWIAEHYAMKHVDTMRSTQSLIISAVHCLNESKRLRKEFGDKSANECAMSAVGLIIAAVALTELPCVLDRTAAKPINN